jgi:hypothetical protein
MSGESVAGTVDSHRRWRWRVVYNYVVVAEMTLVTADEGRASIAVAKGLETERSVAAGKLEDIVVAHFVDVETQLATVHTAAVVADTAEMPQRLGHTVVVTVAVAESLH